MQVIVLGGIARVGKTEVADILEMEAAMLGKNPKRISFSTPLKQACAEKHGYKDPRKFKDEMETLAFGMGLMAAHPERGREYAQAYYRVSSRMDESPLPEMLGPKWAAGGPMAARLGSSTGSAPGARPKS